MKNTLRAIAVGYVRFDVNGRRFYTYDGAMNEAEHLLWTKLDVHVYGFNVFRGWVPLLRRVLRRSDVA